MELRINGENHKIPPNWQAEPLLFVLREYIGFVGAKFGCGVGICGACTVHIDGEARRSCIVMAEDAEGSEIRTLEGLAADGNLHPVQQAWLLEAVPQCGYCQAGQMMSAVALLEQNPEPSEQDIEEAMSGNLCRCGTQQRIRRAVRRAAEAMA